MNADQDEKLLRIPTGAGQAIAETGAVAAAPLLASDRFAKFATDRDLRLDSRRLLRLERLGLFKPVFRVRTPTEDVPELSLPPTPDNNWFEKGWAYDTTGISAYEIPSNPKDGEAYYSRFQLDHLAIVLSSLSLNVHLDSYLDPSPEGFDPSNKFEQWIEMANLDAASLRTHQFRPAIALLCQQISDRYFERTRTDQRTYRAGKSSYWDRWISVSPTDFDEGDDTNWEPLKVTNLYGLTRDRLRHAYETLCSSQRFCDPIENWYPLVQFVSVDQRDRLKGSALRAASIREAAGMLSMLHRELYGEDLAEPNEVNRRIITPIPEVEARADVRRHLEFVANRFGVNPQPRLTLFVEGKTEELVVQTLMPELFGHSPGVVGVEIINLQGVDTATGSRKDDRFRAILRLVDYLHHHQTLTFIILDNENAAGKLKREARSFRSLHHSGRLATRPEYIKVWRTSFEFDNFSATELARALTAVSGRRFMFSVAEVRECAAAGNPGAALASMYKARCGYVLPKTKLATILLETMLSPGSRRALKNRPIVAVLERVENLAALNPLPTMERMWDRNQTSRYFGRRPRRKRADAPEPSPLRLADQSDPETSPAS